MRGLCRCPSAAVVVAKAGKVAHRAGDALFNVVADDVNAGVDLDRVAPEYGRWKGAYTRLHQAALEGNLAAAELLLQRGAKADKADEHGATPLLYAAMYGHPKIAARLLEACADVNSTNRNGRTPLYWADSYGKTGVAAILRAAGGRK